MPKGLTRWFPRNVPPVRSGPYECIVRLCPGAYVRMMVEWNGIGFEIIFGRVIKWRGMTEAAHRAKGAK